VTVDAAIERVVVELSDAHITALIAQCAARTKPPSRLRDTVTGSSLSARDAVDRLAAAWAAEPTMTGTGVAAALRVGMTARAAAAARRTRPVWTGPGAPGEQRLTGMVLHDLVTCAKHRVLLVSYAAYTLPALAADLTHAVDRGCEVDVVFETEEDSAGGYHGPNATPFGAVDGINRWRWPANRRDVPGAALHAKLLVVDGHRALVGSANLTPRALTANLEAGVLIEDRDVAAELEEHVRRLMRSEVLRPV
jgi:phosphatidylserine/phosphatidylglycerophosphate/cardiolipin synthase-like enzyme